MLPLRPVEGKYKECVHTVSGGILLMSGQKTGQDRLRWMRASTSCFGSRSTRCQLVRILHLRWHIVDFCSCRGGVQYEWTSAEVLSTLIIGVLLYVGFILYEWKVPKLPIIDL